MEDGYGDQSINWMDTYADYTETFALSHRLPRPDSRGIDATGAPPFSTKILWRPNWMLLPTFPIQFLHKETWITMGPGSRWNFEYWCPFCQATSVIRRHHGTRCPRCYTPHLNSTTIPPIIPSPYNLVTPPNSCFHCQMPSMFCKRDHKLSTQSLPLTPPILRSPHPRIIRRSNSAGNFFSLPFRKPAPQEEFRALPSIQRATSQSKTSLSKKPFKWIPTLINNVGDSLKRTRKAEAVRDEEMENSLNGMGFISNKRKKTKVFICFHPLSHKN